MRAFYILAAALLLLFLLGQVRVGCRAEYGAGGLTAWVRAGALKFRVFPWKGSKKDKPKKKTGKKPKKKEKKATANQKPENKKPKKTPVREKIGGTLDYAQALLPIALEAAGRFQHKLQIDALYLEMQVGGPDPADAALRYGQASAALGALWTPLTQAFRVKDGEARVTMDFDARETTLYGTVALSLKVGQILWLSLYFGGKALREFLGVRKKHKENQPRKAV